MENTDTSLTASNSAVASAPDMIGRYARAELEAMHGKRGRKPPEYFTIFPERVRVATTPRPKKLAEASMSAAGTYDADPLAARLRLASPAVRRLVANLLDVVDASAPQATQHSAQDSVTAVTPDDQSSAQTMHLQAVLNEPVYADHEAEPELVEQA